MLLLKILVSSREKEINLRRAAPRNGYYPGFTAPAETPIRYGRVTSDSHGEGMVSRDTLKFNLDTVYVTSSRKTRASECLFFSFNPDPIFHVI